MRGIGVRNPRSYLILCLGVTLLSWLCVAWGALLLRGTEEEEPLGPSMMVGLGILPAIFAPFLVWNFWRGVRVFAAIRRGDELIGRWSVSADELAAFKREEAALAARGGENIWIPPHNAPPGRLEVRFVADGVLVGDTYFGLVTIGVFTITGVGLRAPGAPAIVFHTVLSQGDRFSSRASAGELRIPLSRAAGGEASRVLRHFERVVSREIVLHPTYYRNVVRFGLVAGPICVAIAAAGVAMRATGADVEAGIDAEIMIILGLLFGIFALVVALAGAMLRRAQHRRR
jgi:hypothetical protein